MLLADPFREAASHPTAGERLPGPEDTLLRYDPAETF
jgi:hypothetical protein